jgi:hypothetical protein
VVLEVKDNLSLSLLKKDPWISSAGNLLISCRHVFATLDYPQWDTLKL